MYFYSNNTEAMQFIDILITLFKRFDSLVEKNSLTKIKSIGATYIVAGNLPTPCEMAHVRGRNFPRIFYDDMKN